MARVLIPLPARDFDPSEAAVSWQVLSNAGHAVTFATPDSQPAVADDMMLTGEGLDLWGALPLLRKLPLVGLLMRANRDARNAYAAMIADPKYASPLRWDSVDPSAFDGLLLPFGPNGPFGPLRLQDDGADLGAREQRLESRPHHAILGPKLLPDLSRTGRRPRRLHVGAAGGDAGARRPCGLPRRSQIRSGIPAKDLRLAARFHGRCAAGLCRAGPQLYFGEVARRHPYLRKGLCRPAEIMGREGLAVISF